MAVYKYDYVKHEEFELSKQVSYIFIIECSQVAVILCRLNFDQNKLDSLY